ncbi:MAG: aldose 1-epimerase [Alphaproteobacteria bacterium]|nr:aldose 1-epimerase [Alphaproteobacteria bacterium]
MLGPLILSSGAVSAVVEPAFGGRISAFRHGGRDLFAPIPEGGARDLDAPASGGCFPLVPWSNRIRDARLRLRGDTVELTPTELPAGHAIHGHGLRRIWGAEQEGGTVRMLYTHDAGVQGWPWSYRASQTVSVDQDGMTISLSVTQSGSEGQSSAMPVGLGLHPYFPRTGGTQVTLPVETAWPPTEADKFPVQGGHPVPLEQDLGRAAAVPLGLDQGFGGWSRTAEICWPDRGLALTMTGKGPLEHVIVYTPTQRDYFCLEPVTHAIDAANLSENHGVTGTGHLMLAAGEELSVSLRFTVKVL